MSAALALYVRDLAVVQAAGEVVGLVIPRNVQQSRPVCGLHGELRRGTR